jgi:hypothetical protein
MPPRLAFEPPLPKSVTFPIEVRRRTVLAELDRLTRPPG